MKKTGLGLFIEELREAAKLTQVELDAKAGFPLGTIGQLESGARKMSNARLEQLAPALGVTVKQLLLGSSEDLCVEMELLMVELNSLSPDALLELTLQVRKDKAFGRLV